MIKHAVVETVPVQSTETALTPMGMLQIAVEKGATPETLERMMALQERWEAREARNAYVQAKAAFNANPPKIEKHKNVHFVNRKGDVTDYNHATLDHIVSVVNPLLSEQGLSYHWETAQENERITVSCILTHVLGHSEKVSLQGVADESGGKNRVQGVGSTVSYLQRYTLLSMLGLAPTEADTDGRTDGEKITDKQRDELKVLIDETGADIGKFCAWLEVDSLSDIPGDQFNRAKFMLDRKRTEK